MLPDGLSLRHPVEADHPRLFEALASWWGDLGGAAGRLERALLVPRLFLQHFTDTSYLVERPDGRLAAFLIGFRSQSQPDVAYVHFVGVDPELRRQGVAATLYARFIEDARGHGAREVRCITSPANATSQAFHAGIVFELGAVAADYDGSGLDRVSFVLRLDPR